MPRCLSFLLLMAFAGQVHAAQETDLAALWKTGCLWEVGDNRQKVAQARDQLIAMGEPAMRYALTQLDTTSTLDTRCLQAVFRGWGTSALDALIENIGHEKPAARRNVADLLFQLNDARAEAPLLAQAKLEAEPGVRIAQLAPLARWKSAPALPLLLESSRAVQQRLRARTPSMLAEYTEASATARLIEMLQDETYHVALAARTALLGAPTSSRHACLGALRTELDKTSGQATVLIRHLCPIVATVADNDTHKLLHRALGHATPGVRADAAIALARWKTGAGLMDSDIDVAASLKAALNRETDPFARAEIERAGRTLAESGKSQ